MKHGSYIQPILQCILPPELQPYADPQVWKSVGTHLLNKLLKKR